MRSRTPFWITVAVLLAAATILDLVGLRVVWDGFIWLVTAVLVAFVAAIAFGRLRNPQGRAPGEPGEGQQESQHEAGPPDR